MEIRTFEPGDSAEELTRLLNAAYRELAEQGLRYVASWQTPEMTRERLGFGQCFIAVDRREIVGTAMLYQAALASECRFYLQSGVLYFGKFGVLPERRGEGIGRALYLKVEDAARTSGATYLGCDTAEPATNLIEMYRAWGFEVVEKVDWPLTNYVSVVLAKRL